MSMLAGIVALIIVLALAAGCAIVLGTNNIVNVDTEPILRREVTDKTLTVEEVIGEVVKPSTKAASAPPTLRR